MAEPTLAERFDKIRSPNLESQKHTATILNLVESTIKGQNIEATPSSYFTSILTILIKCANEDPSSKNTAATIYLLDVVAPFTPAVLLRSKFTQILSSLGPILQQSKADAPIIRPSIGCFESLLLAQNAASWDLSVEQVSSRRAMAGLLRLSVDPRPKVRKRALEALHKVLDSRPQGVELDHPASLMCAETAMASLRSLAERASQSKKDKRSGSQPMHDPELFHALQLVREIASSGTGWPSKRIDVLCELLMAIARTGNDHMSVAVLEVFELIFQGMSDQIASSKLNRLMEIISELRPAPNDTQLLPPWIAVLSRGYDVSAQVEPEDTFYKLPDLFEMVAPYLESPLENIRLSGAECLVSFLANCIPKQVILEPSIYDEKIFSKLAEQAENLLTVRYQAATKEVYTVLEAMYEALRWQSNPYLLDITKTIGDLRGSQAFSAKKEADKLIGQAIRAMGPGAILKILPHNLTRASPDHPGRAWLLPLFRDYTTNTNLADFRTEFVTLSNALYQTVIDNGEKEKTTEIKIFETIVQQIWSILPAFCDLPLDLRTAFDSEFAELLANVLYQQVELRHDVCRALRTLIESNQLIAAIEDVEDDLYLQCRVSKAEARANLEHLGSLSSQYLAVLFNVYGQTLAQSRGPVLQTINAFLSITPVPDLVKSFDQVCTMLAAALQEPQQKGSASNNSATQVPSTTHTLMDLVITMAMHLPRESYSALFEIAALTVNKDDDPQLQKKAYKMIPRLAESEVGQVALTERHQELQAMILASADKVTAPARRERLAALAALLPLIPDNGLHFIPATLSEVVICCKESNERARSSAFELLVLMGTRMVEAKGTKIDIAKVPNMASDAPAARASIEEFFTMVSAGLAGSTPHMISASITAITRTLYEFHDILDRQSLSDLVQTVDLFLTSNNREIVRSVLGFVKVCAISLPEEMMRPRLATLIPNLMVWGHEHKGHFRAKVKHILERMVRRFGFDTVNKYCPEADRKLINNIRKTKERNKKKKKAAFEEVDDGSDDGEEEDATAKKGRFESGFDEALYSSSDDDSDAEDDNNGQSKQRGATAGNKKQRGAKGGQAYIIEEDGEPLDLLGRNAMASISSTRPVQMRKPNKTKVKFNADGKLIIGGGDNDGAGDGMDVDMQDADGGAGNGVNAYLDAVSGKDVPKRGFRGKLKWSNKKGQDDNDDDDEGGATLGRSDAAAVKKHLDRTSPGNRREKQPFRGGGGRGGNRGGVSFGRRGLGEDKRRQGGGAGRVSKPFPKKR